MSPSPPQLCFYWTLSTGLHYWGCSGPRWCVALAGREVSVLGVSLVSYQLVTPWKLLCDSNYLSLSHTFLQESDDWFMTKNSGFNGFPLFLSVQHGSEQPTCPTQCHVELPCQPGLLTFSWSKQGDGGTQVRRVLSWQMLSPSGPCSWGLTSLCFLMASSGSSTNPPSPCWRWLACGSPPGSKCLCVLVYFAWTHSVAATHQLCGLSCVCFPLSPPTSALSCGVAQIWSLGNAYVALALANEGTLSLAFKSCV